jgi:hypothetical protein
MSHDQEEHRVIADVPRTWKDLQPYFGTEREPVRYREELNASALILNEAMLYEAGRTHYGSIDLLVKTELYVHVRTR